MPQTAQYGVQKEEKRGEVDSPGKPELRQLPGVVDTNFWRDFSKKVCRGGGRGGQSQMVRAWSEPQSMLNCRTYRAPRERFNESPL